MIPETKLVYLRAELDAILKKEESLAKRTLEIMAEIEDIESSISKEL